MALKVASTALFLADYSWLDIVPDSIEPNESLRLIVGLWACMGDGSGSLKPGLNSDGFG